MYIIEHVPFQSVSHATLESNNSVCMALFGL